MAIMVMKTSMQILGGLILADFVTGIFHWFEDRYGNPKWPILGRTIEANQRHHHKPRDFLNGPVWRRNREVWVLGLMFLGLFTWAGWLNAFTITAVVVGMLANEIHGAAHRMPRENWFWVKYVQKTGLMQSFQHHAQHHRKGKDTHYCVVTNYTNPILEKIKFFPLMERVIKVLTGAVPRLDDSVNPKYRKAT